MIGEPNMKSRTIFISAEVEIDYTSEKARDEIIRQVIRDIRVNQACWVSDGKADAILVKARVVE